MLPKNIVSLTEEQRTHLFELTGKGTIGARAMNHARMLLLSDDGKIDKEIAYILHTTTQCVARVRKRFVDGGIDMALFDKPRSGAPRKLDGKQEALLVAYACSDPPEGHIYWTMQLLADKLIEMHVIESLSDETVRRVLKKMNLNLGKKSPGVSQP